MSHENRERNTHPGPRVFITSLKDLEIVYLPATGQITSRLPVAISPVTVAEQATPEAEN